jgi:membrane fusion protein, multidrug efflux system
MTKKKSLTILLLMVIVVGLSLHYYKQHQAKQAAELAAKQIKPMEVLVTQIIKQDVPMTKEWVGTTQGDVNADIFPKVSGYLLKMNYDEGSTVQVGQLLFEIDSRPYQAAVDAAQGDLEKAYANQKKSESDVKRYGSLVKEGAVSRKEYTDAVRTNEMNKAAISSAKAALEQAKLNLDWTKVASPITGLAGSAIAQVGDLVDPSKKLTTVSVIDPIKVIFPLSENEYIWYQKMHLTNKDGAPVSTGPEIDIILSDGSVYPQKGAFSFADRQIDPGTGTISVQIKAPNPDGFLRPGQYAKVRAQVGTFNDALVIPRRAIIETQGTTQVAVVTQDNKVEMRDIKVGYIFGNNRIVTDGLKEGESIIVEGFLKIKEGMTVSPKPYSPAKES